MDAFIAALSAIWTFLLNVLTQVFNLYTGTPVLVAVFALWVLDRIFGIFKFMRG